MEEIAKLLLEGEEISWKHVKMKNLLIESVIEIVIGFALIISLSLLFNYITYLMRFEEIHALFALLYLVVPIIVAVTCGIGIILPGIKKLNQMTNNLQSSPNDLRYYEEISVISNKRLIQKSYNAFKIDYSENPISDLENFEIFRDMVFINLSAIKVVIAEKLDTSYQLGFKFSIKDDNLIPLLISIPINLFPSFIDELTERIPLKHKKRKDNYIVNYFQK